jgi:hypothetical protein
MANMLYLAKVISGLDMTLYTKLKLKKAHKVDKPRGNS